MYARSQAERTALTRQALERVARTLFETRGFADVSAEEIVAQAGVTRGALYHHYGGKEGLFEAVTEAAMQRMHDHIARVAGDAADAITALKLGLGRFLELGATPRTQRLLFIDAPVVMGWHRWREMDRRYGFGLLKQAVDRATAEGRMRAQPSTLVAHLLLSAAIEAAMVIARSDHKQIARVEAERVLGQLVDGLT